MKNLILFVLFCATTSFAISGYSPYKIYAQKDTVTHINLDSNIVRPSSWSVQIADTLDKKFIRFYDLEHHDSTLSYMAADTVKSPNMLGTTIKGVTDLFLKGDYTYLQANTEDGTDNRFVVIGGGGGATSYITGSPTRGGQICVGGNESASTGGINIIAGNGNGTTTGTVNVAPRMYLGTRPANDLFQFKSDSALIPILQGNVVTRGTSSVDSLNSTKGVTAPRGFIDSLRLGSGDWFKTFDTGSFACTLKTTVVTVEQIGIINYTVIGNVVTLSIPIINGTSNSASFTLSCGGVPEIIKPSSFVSGPIARLFDNGIAITGMFAYYEPSVKGLLFYRYDGAPWSTSGLKGFATGAGSNPTTTIQFIKK